MKRMNLISHLLALAVLTETANKFADIDSPTSFDPESVKDKVKPIPSNHREFIINGVSIWALNQKNADRRYKNMVHKQTINS